jgi:N-acetylmuramate 1-kinase
VNAAERAAVIAGFLAANGWAGFTPTPLAGDASFRRYHRVASGQRRAVVMDAPPPESVRSYVTVARLLRGFGLSTPEIYAADGERGVALIEDFGDTGYTRLLADGADEASLYTLAVDTLIALHRGVETRGMPDLPSYEEGRFLTEAALLVDWYIPAALDRPLTAAARADYLARWQAVLPLAQAVAPTLVLRDYHVDNLMLLPGRAGVAACGLLDFQDAVIGPPAYDLASLLQDARRDVPAALQRAMTERYLAAFPSIDGVAFQRSTTILAAQRSAKIIGLFVRLSRRDGKPAYLAHLPRVWRLFEDALRREPALASVAAWLDRHLPPDRRGALGVRSAA